MPCCQFGEMERLHLHVQQLQLEMADAREKSGSQSDVSHVSHANSNDVSRLEHVNGIQSEVNDNNSPSVNTGSLENGNSETSGGSTLILVNLRSFFLLVLFLITFSICAFFFWS